MSDKSVKSVATDLAVRPQVGIRSWLPRANRLWIIKYALVMTAATNLVINGLLAWLTTIGHSHLPLFAVPFIAPPSLVTDTLGTFAILPVTTSVLCSLGVRGYHHRGLLNPIRLPSACPVRWLDRLGGTDLRAGAVLAGWTTALLAPGACALLVALGSSGVSRGSFVVYKAALGVVLGAVITPLVALRAMSQGPVSSSRLLR